MPADVAAEPDVVLFAVPKKGRLHQDVMKLLNGAGLDAKRPDRLDVAMCNDVPVKLVFLPAADIPSYVMEGNVDVGISGSDMLEEAIIEDQDGAANVKVLQHLGFGKCKLCLEAPVAAQANGKPEAFAGKRIVTSFPGLARRYFKKFDEERGVSTHIKVVSGSVEAACQLGLADAVVDLVETGTTMKAAGLEVVSQIFESEALLFQQLHNGKETERTTKAETIEVIIKRIGGYLTAMRYMMLIYNCHVSMLEACTKITPGKRSPTITKLQDDGWHAVSVLVEKGRSNATMDALAKAGAQDVLCIPILNTRM